MNGFIGVVHLEMPFTGTAICLAQDKPQMITEDGGLATCQSCKLKAALVAVNFILMADRAEFYCEPTMQEVF